MTDKPWRWYCRLCGDEDTASNCDDRNSAAEKHMQGPCGRGDVMCRDEAGRLLHVWSYSEVRT